MVQNIIITLLRIRIYRGPRLCWIHNRIIRCHGVGHVHRRRRCGGKRRHFVWDKKKFGRNLSTFQVLQSRHFFTMITIFCNKVYLIFSHNESYQIFRTWYIVKLLSKHMNWHDCTVITVRLFIEKGLVWFEYSAVMQYILHQTFK